jgi:hypothetical protein
MEVNNEYKKKLAKNELTNRMAENDSYMEV